MSKKFIALLVGCGVTIGLFIVMCILMSTVNPDPLPTEKSPPVLQPRRDMFGSDTEIISPSLRRANSQQDYYSVTDDYNSLILYTVQRVIPPLWPPTPPPPKEETVLPTQANENTSKVEVFQAPSEDNETVFIIDKRSVDNFEPRTNDTDAIVLKLIDDSGQFNVEIKIRPNDALAKNKGKTRKIKSRDIRKYSVSLKTKSNDLFKINELAKNTVIHVKPNDTVSINEYDDNFKLNNQKSVLINEYDDQFKLDNQKIRQDDEIQGSIVNLINDTTSNRPEELK